MKEFESQQFRDELAKKIKEAPKEDRRGILDRAKEEARIVALEKKLSPENYVTLRKEIRAHIFKSKAHIKERIAHLQK